MSRKGLVIEDVFCKGADPYTTVEWTKRTIEMKEGDKVIFRQEGVEVPSFWSDNAAMTAATKYFRGGLGTPSREHSVKQVFNRVVDEIVKHGVSLGVFDKENGRIYGNNLKWLLIHQYYSFNSPVYFNVGAEKEPQGAACFILELRDDLESISGVQHTLVLIFSRGSGGGYNLSFLREYGAPLSKGGHASGPLSFLLGYDAWGGIIMSGGVQRRAAMLARLDDWHPDVFRMDGKLDFISMKAREERKARALVKKGYTVEEAYATVSCQNVNLSVGLGDAFMRAALDGKDWTLKSVLTGKTVRTIKASEMLQAIAENACFCGDPGVQFDDTINRWNPLIKLARILSTNPCAEFCAPPNNACNLASLNLVSFYDSANGFKDEDFQRAVEFSIIAQDLLVNISGYPTEEITENARNYRPLGLGYTNLGGLFMKMGIVYDSDIARAWASLITSYMTATAFIMSSNLAKITDTFQGYDDNRKAMMAVLKMHKMKFAGVMDQYGSLLPRMDKAEDLWEKAYSLAAKQGVRNCMVTLIAPAGTISHMMDCTTTGIEPLLFIIAKKTLAGGGEMTLLNESLGETFTHLGYDARERDILMEYIRKTGNLDGSPIKPQHIAIFDPVYPLRPTDRHISIQGQMQMMAAVQPFISGAISKTFGLPNTATASDVKEIIVSAWKLGLKAVSIFRDGSKMSQPLVNALSKNGLFEEDDDDRERLPDDTDAKKHRVNIGGSKMYIIPSFYPDGRLGEVFLNGLGKNGSTLRELMDAIMTCVSIGFQHGIPLETYAEKFVGTTFSPKGLTSNPKIRMCTSILDYIFRYLDMTYGEGLFVDDKPGDTEAQDEKPVQKFKRIRNTTREILTGETCPKCGSLAHRIGSCLICLDRSCSQSKAGACG